MIVTDIINNKSSTCQFDIKSQVSTQGEENYDYHSLETFLFNQKNSHCQKIYKSKLKSSLCRNFTQNGVCPYGSKCQFAHGTHELRINEDANNSYKTKPCNAFFKKGYCQYGYRCNFVHSRFESVDQKKWQKMYNNHRQVFQNIKGESGSKVLKMLQ